MEKLEFTTNWNNKLDCKCFTTIRIFNPSKHFKGNQFEINLKKKFKGKAIVLGIIKAYLKDLNDYMCYLDTGYNREETTQLFLRMYPKIDFRHQQIVVILLKKIEPLKPQQTNLFN